MASADDRTVLQDDSVADAAILADHGILEIAVQGAQRVGSAYNGRVNDWVIIAVRRHDTGSRAGKNNLGNILCSKIAEVFGYLFVSESR